MGVNDIYNIYGWKMDYHTFLTLLVKHKSITTSELEKLGTVQRVNGKWRFEDDEEEENDFLPNDFILLIYEVGKKLNIEDWIHRVPEHDYEEMIVIGDIVETLEVYDFSKGLVLKKKKGKETPPPLKFLDNKKRRNILLTDDCWCCS